MKEHPSDLNQRIARRVRELRSAHRLSLAALAGKTGVSRSMISLIERGECSPTAMVLEKLAAGLGVVLASLFDPSSTEKLTSSRGPLARRKDQPEWQDPDSGYIRRNVSPTGVPSPMHLVEVRFPAGARVAFENLSHSRQIHQQVWILGGTMEIIMGDDRYRLKEGDCLATQLDRPILFRNPTRKTARYAVITVSESPSRR
jgi:transcriptional regulator with XRE-family HTH domain